MAKVLFVAVRKDVERAETLAELFESAGIDIISPFNEDTLDECDAAVVIWSRAAARCAAFLAAARSALQSDKAIAVCLKGAPADVLAQTGAFDLSRWNGSAHSALLDDFFYAAYAKVIEANRVAGLEADLDDDAEESDDDGFAANDNPPSFDEFNAQRDDLALNTGWTAPLPDAPLPTLTAKRFAAKKKPSMSQRFFRSGVRVALVAALFTTAGFLGSLASPHAPTPPVETSLSAFITEASALDDAGDVDMADVAQPVWEREPASAPELRAQGG